MTRVCFILVLFSLISCRKESITSVWVPKEETASPISPIVNNHPEIVWTVPEGWMEQPASDMRVGSFQAKAANNELVDISIVSLSGQAGGMLANVNRWRGQIQLPPIEEKDLSHESKLITVGGRQMDWIEMANQKRRIIAAVYEHQGQTWFFKMSGDDAAVNTVKSDFREFLSNLRFK